MTALEAAKKGKRYSLAWDIAWNLDEDEYVSLCEFLDETELWKWPRMGQIIWDIYQSMYDLDTEYIEEMRAIRARQEAKDEEAIDNYIGWYESYEHFV